MNSQTDNPSEDAVDSRHAAASSAQTRPLYWSVRREIWENRSIYLAPLIVAAVVLLASAISTIGLPRRVRDAETLDPGKRHAAIVKHFNMAPAPIMLATFLVGFFYSLDALYGERRDRSILFWKSLPVSDQTTVLAKASIPLVVLPSIALALSIAAQLPLLMLSTMVLLGSGMNPATVWREFHFLQGLLVMIYGLAVHALWFAPIYGWLMMISAWARRAPILWAVFPFLALGAVEHIVFNSSTFMYMLQYRITGAMKEAFDLTTKRGGDIEHLSQLNPMRFLSAPGLWVGLVFAALCLVAAVRLRRSREPI